MKQTSLFNETPRLSIEEAMELTRQSLACYGDSHRRWGIAWSGGKDSTATLAIVLHLLDSGQINRPQELTVFYADTRQELPPLAIAANHIMDSLRQRGKEI